MATYCTISCVGFLPVCHLIGCANTRFEANILLPDQNVIMSLFSNGQVHRSGISAKVFLFCWYITIVCFREDEDEDEDEEENHNVEKPE